MSIHYSNPFVRQHIRNLLGETEDREPLNRTYGGAAVTTVTPQKAKLNMLIAALAFIAFMHLFVRTVKEAG